MRMKIYNTIERKEKSSLTYYFFAVIVGLLIFFILLVIFKGASFLINMAIKLVVNYWIFILGGIAGLLFIRKLLFRRRIKTNAMYQPEM